MIAANSERSAKPLATLLWFAAPLILVIGVMLLMGIPTHNGPSD